MKKKWRQKSCDTLPFTLFLYLQLPFCHFLCFSYLSILFKFFLLVYYTIFPSCVLPVLPTFLFSLLALQPPPVQHFCLFTCSVLTNVVFITVSLQLLDEGKNGQEESAYQQARPSCGIGSISSQTCKWTCYISILNILKIMSFCSIADPGIIKNSFL